MASRVSKSFMRLMVVQICYQYFYYADGRSIDEVVDGVVGNYALKDEDEISSFKSKIDKKFFNLLIENLLENLAVIDAKIGENLQDESVIDDLDKVALQILRVALSEFMVLNTPPKVVISEFADIGGSFFDDKNTNFVNGI